MGRWEYVSSGQQLISDTDLNDRGQGGGGCSENTLCPCCDGTKATGQAFTSALSKHNHITVVFSQDSVSVPLARNGIPRQIHPAPRGAHAQMLQQLTLFCAALCWYTTGSPRKGDMSSHRFTHMSNCFLATRSSHVLKEHFQAAPRALLCEKECHLSLPLPPYLVFLCYTSRFSFLIALSLSLPLSLLPLTLPQLFLCVFVRPSIYAPLFGPRAIRLQCFSPPLVRADNFTRDLFATQLSGRVSVWKTHQACPPPSPNTYL